MQKRAGTFIVIEGIDGSGKGTQFELLCERLRQAGYQVETFDFPQYNSPSSYFVKQYLNGEYGNNGQVGPYTSSLFYALDRFEAAPRIRDALAKGKVVISNRFTGSSMGHQGTKFKSPEERRGYFIWLDNLEFEMLQIPRPDISFILRVPADTAQKLIDQKLPRSYTDKKRDIHEADTKHLEKSIEVYDDLCQLFPKDFQRIDCVRGGTLLPIDTIQNMLWEKITPLLPPPPQLELTTKDIPSPAAAAVETPSISKTVQPSQPQAATLPEPVANPQAAKDTATADTDTNAAATDKTQPQPQAQQAQTDKQVQGFREVTAQHFALENTSQLLAQAVGSSRFTAYAGEPDYQNQDYTKKDESENYKYHVPKTLDEPMAVRYKTYMDAIFDLHRKIAESVAGHLAHQSYTPVAKQDESWRNEIRKQALQVSSAVLPAAATTKIIVLAFGKALEDLVVELLGSGLPELRTAGKSLLNEARELSPGFLKDADNQANQDSPILYHSLAMSAVGGLARDLLPEQHVQAESGVRLTEAWPRNELDILPDILYSHCNLSLSDLYSHIAGMPYNRKLDLMEAYLGHRTSTRQAPGNALSKIHYTWDVVSEYGTLRELQRLQLVAGASFQDLTPRYGYNVPKIIEDSGAADDYERCFDLSLELHSHLQQAGRIQEAQYAVLQGHRTRWKLSQSGQETLRLIEKPATPAATQLALQMLKTLAETHPLIAEIAIAPGNHSN